MSEPSAPLSNFIADRITEDRSQGKHDGRVVTRFPPEPNGYLHIGHAKSICLNFGLAKDFGGRCNLRFDDTNPVTEDVEYVESIQNDIRWLGFEWDELRFASDYFDQLYAWAMKLIDAGFAYVDESSAEEMAKYRGDFTTPGRPTPYRSRSVEENRALFEKMRAGGFEEGKAVLRAKIDVNHPNMNMRDPVIYRIKKAHHHRTGDKWCIYPMYDYAHPLSDAVEAITHSICTLEFEDHRPFYDWCIETVDTPAKPQQIEFARLKLNYTVMSKRKLLQLVGDKLVDGWDDPRMLTISGLRRRGYTASSIRAFAHQIGVSKTNSWIDMGVLENCIRDDLNANAPRAMAVLRPLTVNLTNLQEERLCSLSNHPQKPELGHRELRLLKTIFIEREDFEEVPPKGFFRLTPGGWVRLRGAGYIRCDAVHKNAEGDVTSVDCTWHAPIEGNEGPEGKKVKGTIHWVPGDSPKATVRLYDRLFSVEQPDGDDWKQHLNPHSRVTLTEARMEAGLLAVKPGDTFQFERNGYFCADAVESKPGAPVWNRVVSLKDSWAPQK